MKDRGDFNLIIFDFDGVLCKNKFFYCNESKKKPGLLKKIDDLVFGEKHIIIDKWMRGDYKYGDVINIIEKELGISKKDIKLYLFKSIELFKISKNFINLLEKLKRHKYKLILVSNNVDIFDLISINCNLKKYFEYIIKSTDIGYLKHEKNGILYDFALSKVNNIDFKNCLLIDDSKKACNAFKNKNGSAIQYVGFKEMMENLRILLYNTSL